MESLRDELFFCLVDKTKVLGHQVSFQEMSDDSNMPEPNDYAYYYGSFLEAARQAWEIVKMGDDEITRLKEEKAKGVIIVSGRQYRQLSPERTEAVVSEVVDMYIAADGQMPSKRDLKKNRYISEKEVSVLRQNGEISEFKIRKLAEEKTGRTFLTQVERQKAAAAESRKRRLAMIAAAKEAEEKLSKVEMEPVVETQEEVNKMGEEKKAKRYTSEECKELLRRACRETRHVLTQAEVNELSKTGELPGWGTLQRQVGPWWHWGEMFNVPFANEKVERIAAVKLQEEEKDRLALELAKEAENVSAEAEPVTSEEIAPPPVLVEPEEEKVETREGLELREIPIRLIIPVGIKGTVQISLEF